MRFTRFLRVSRFTVFSQFLRLSRFSRSATGDKFNRSIARCACGLNNHDAFNGKLSVLSDIHTIYKNFQLTVEVSACSLLGLVCIVRSLLPMLRLVSSLLFPRIVDVHSLFCLVPTCVVLGEFRYGKAVSHRCHQMLYRSGR